MTGTLFIISGPSGVGKNTLIEKVLPRLKAAFPITRAITYTSRQPRCNEKDGVDYHFVSPDEFESLQKAGFFIEWSTAYGNYYGLPRTIIEALNQGASFLVLLDRNGIAQLRNLNIAHISIGIRVEADHILEQRLLVRGTETKEAIDARLLLAKVEKEEESQNALCDYCINNEDIEKAASQLEHIIMQLVGNCAAQLRAEKDLFSEKN